MRVAFVRYSATLGSPLLLPTPEGDPNSVRSALYIPGSAIRGAVARAAGSSAAAISELVLSGGVRYLNAYPVPHQEGVVRSLPVPSSWRKEKYAPYRIRELAGLAQDEVPELESVGVSFVTPGARIVGFDPAVEAHFHHQRDRRMGRATEERGAVFTYEAIAPQTRFCGIVCVAGQDANEIERKIEDLKRALGGLLRLGRSRNSQYGGNAKVVWDSAVSEREVVEISAQPLRIVGRDLNPGQQFRALLTAHAILRNPATGQYDPDVLAVTLEQALVNKAAVTGLFTSRVLVSSFNATWRLALPQAWAAAAGTVVLLEAKVTISIGELLEIEARGVGERRSEGFGALVFLEEPLDPVSLEVHKPRGKPARRPDAFPSELALLERRLLRRGLERAVLTFAAARGGSASAGTLPSASLLGRLRTPLRTAGGCDTLRQWLGPERGKAGLRSTAAEQLEACRVGSRSLDDELRWMLQVDPAELLKRLFSEGAPVERYTLKGSLDDDSRRQLGETARRLLIDAFLSTLQRRAKYGSRQ